MRVDEWGGEVDLRSRRVDGGEAMLSGGTCGEGVWVLSDSAGDSGDASGRRSVAEGALGAVEFVLYCGGDGLEAGERGTR